MEWSEYILTKKRSGTYVLNTCAFFCFLIVLVLIVLLRVFKTDEFLSWYSRYTETLANYEIWLQTGGATLLSVFIILVNYVLKALIPWFPISCICVASALVFKWHHALLINVAGLIVLFTIKFFWGRKYGGGNAEKILSRYDTAHTFIDSSKLGSRVVLFFLRLIPVFPINSVSCLYGTTNISYPRYIVISLLGYTYRLLSYITIGRNVFDPASASFIVPLIILLFFSGVVLLSLSGAISITVKK